MKKKLPIIIAFLVAIVAIVGIVVFLVSKFSDDKENTDTVTNVVEVDGDKEGEPSKNDGSEETDKPENSNETTEKQDVKYEDYNGTEVVVVSSEKVEESKNNKSTADVEEELKNQIGRAHV